MTLSFPTQLQHLASGKGEETHEEWMGRHQGQQRTCQAPRMLRGPSSNLQASGRKEEKQEPKLQTCCCGMAPGEQGAPGWEWDFADGHGAPTRSSTLSGPTVTTGGTVPP